MSDVTEERFQTLHEIVQAAEINLNRNIWDYLVGATETETTMRRNRLALDFDRLPPARAARRLRGRLHGQPLRQEAPSAGRRRPGRVARVLRARRRRHGRRGDRGVRRRAVPELGDEARPRGDRRQGAQRPQDLPALCPRRRCLDRRLCPSHVGGGVRRLLHHRRHGALQPARARHHQALRQDLAHLQHRDELSGGVQLEGHRALQGEAQGSAHPQGHRHRRGCVDRP